MSNLHLEKHSTPGPPSQCIEAVFAVVITNTWGQTMSGIARPPSRPLALRPRLPALRCLNLVTGLVISLVPSGVAAQADRLQHDAAGPGLDRHGRVRGKPLTPVQGSELMEPVWQVADHGSNRACLRGFLQAR